MRWVNRTSDVEVDGFAISVIVLSDRVACSAFKDKILYSATWQKATLMQCSLSAGSEPTDNPLPAGLLAAFWKARKQALAV